MSCYICLNKHLDPKIEYPKPGFLMNDPTDRGLDNVYYACSFSDECAKAIAGSAFKSFHFDRETRKVHVDLNDRKIHLLTSGGYDKERELTIREIQILVINQLKLAVGSK